MSAMGRLHLPLTWAYLGAILTVVMTGLSIVTNEGAWEEYEEIVLIRGVIEEEIEHILEHHVHKCTSLYISE